MFHLQKKWQFLMKLVLQFCSPYFNKKKKKWKNGKGIKRSHKKEKIH